jgi:hypothetical protein
LTVALLLLTLWEPPLTLPLAPLAKLCWPPLMLAALPLAELNWPPLTLAASNMIVFASPATSPPKAPNPVEAVNLCQRPINQVVRSATVAGIERRANLVIANDQIATAGERSPRREVIVGSFRAAVEPECER